MRGDAGPGAEPVRGVPDTLSEASVGDVPVAGGDQRKLEPSIRPGAGPLAILRGQQGLASQVAVFLGFFAFWELAARVDLVASSTFPPVTKVFVRLTQLITDPALWDAAYNTLIAWVIGLILCTIIGSTVGIVIGSNDFLLRSSRLVLDFFRSVPPPALIFLFLLLWGRSLGMKVALIVSGPTFHVIINAIYGVQSVSPVVHDMATSYRIRRRDRFFRIQLPAALPFIAVGVRLTTTIALVIAVTAEFLTGAKGLGQFIELVRQTGDYPGMYAVLVFVGVVAVVLNKIVLQVERRVLRWHPSHRAPT